MIINAIFDLFISFLGGMVSLMIFPSLYQVVLSMERKVLGIFLNTYHIIEYYLGFGLRFPGGFIVWGLL